MTFQTPSSSAPDAANRWQHDRKALGTPGLDGLLVVINPFTRGSSVPPTEPANSRDKRVLPIGFPQRRS